MLYSRTCLQRLPYWLENYDLSRQVVFGDRFIYIEVCDFCQKLVSQDRSGLMAVVCQRQFSLYFNCYFLPGMFGLLRQVVSHCRGLFKT